MGYKKRLIRARAQSQFILQNSFVSKKMADK